MEFHPVADCLSRKNKYAFHLTKNILPFSDKHQYIGVGKDCILEIVPSNNRPGFSFVTLFRAEILGFDRALNVKSIPCLLNLLGLSMHNFFWRKTPHHGVRFDPWQFLETTRGQAWMRDTGIQAWMGEMS